MNYVLKDSKILFGFETIKKGLNTWENALKDKEFIRKYGLDTVEYTIELFRKCLKKYGEDKLIGWPEYHEFESSDFYFDGYIIMDPKSKEIIGLERY